MCLNGILFQMANPFSFFLIVTQESDLPFFIIISILIFVKTIKTTVLIQSLTLTKWFAASESRPVLSHCLRSVIQVKWAVLQVIRQPAACDVFKNKDTVLKNNACCTCGLIHVQSCEKPCYMSLCSSVNAA